mgnify:CR=1 FL=1
MKYLNFWNNVAKNAKKYEKFAIWLILFAITHFRSFFILFRVNSRLQKRYRMLETRIPKSIKDSLYIWYVFKWLMCELK